MLTRRYDGNKRTGCSAGGEYTIANRTAGISTLKYLKSKITLLITLDFIVPIQKMIAFKQPCLKCIIVLLLKDSNYNKLS